MKATVGDRIMVASTHLDTPSRAGRVVEVRHEDGTPPYVVEWADTGERTLFFPGPDTHVAAADGGGAGGEGTAGGDGSPAGADGSGEGVAAGRSVKTWTVQIRITEDGDDTTATAVLGLERAAAPDELSSTGATRRNPADPVSSEIGDEVAVARALRRLADDLLGRARTDIGESTGTTATLPR